MTLNKGAFVVSLDFELYWGWRDICSKDSFQAQAEKTRPAVLRLLELFRAYQIHATWASVGLLFFKNRKDLLAGLPEIKPEYTDKHLSPYNDIDNVGLGEQDDPFHYAPSMIRAILDTPHQELGTHTFSHYYCAENGQTVEAFRSDLAAAIAAAKKWKVQLRSIVFPRNQIKPEYLDVCADLGIRTYRGAQQFWCYRGGNRPGELLTRRAVRLLDLYMKISGHNSFVPFPLPGQTVDVRASCFLRSYTPRLHFLEPLRFARINRSLDFAATRGHVFHLWFHPEEIALHVDENLAFLERILQKVSQLRDRGIMESLNMAEVAERLLPAALECAEMKPACMEAS